MTRPFFTHDKISHFEIFDRHAEDVINQIKLRLSEGVAVDIQVRVGHKGYQYNGSTIHTVTLGCFRSVYP
jgi:hypothetical protein